jgi:predicted ribosomally synthesized peptide with SipW-like signal peptide
MVVFGRSKEANDRLLGRRYDTRGVTTMFGKLATSRGRKIRALMAGGLVLGVGSAATLAAWTDTEWVWGGDGTGNNLGTSSFEIEQNVWDGAGGTANWTNREVSPGGELTFAVDAADLTPGDTVYAPMQLRTAADSDGGDVTLDGAVNLLAPDVALFDALVYGARFDVGRADCTAVGFAANGTELVASGSSLATGSGATSFALVADGANTVGAEVDVCFAVTLPDIPANQALQGEEARPAWAFQGISN